MRCIRANVRRHRGPEMSVPQFRTMAFIGRNKGAALSDVAAHLGLTLPSSSKLVEGLVAAKLATREVHSQDRRCVVLALTSAGQKRYEAARRKARDFLAEKLVSLGGDERERMLEATRTLKAIFSEAERQGSGRKSAANGAKQPKK